MGISDRIMRDGGTSPGLLGALDREMCEGVFKHEILIIYV